MLQTVRPKTRRGHTPSAAVRAIQAVVRTLDAGSPAVAARVAERLMFRTHRRDPSAQEQKLLAEGASFRIPSRFGDLAAWSWGEGPPIVLVHGWNGRGSQLGAFVPGLVASGFRVVAFDSPGHGASPGSRATILDFASAIDSVIDAVRPTFGPIQGIVAHSMGGPATVLAASRVLTLDPTSLDRAARDVGLPVRRFVFIAPPIDVQDFMHAVSRELDLSTAAEDELRRLVEKRIGKSVESLYAPLHVRNFTAPLLLIHDRSDREVPLSRGSTLARAWPGSEFVVTEGLGHQRILRDRDVVRRTVEFIRR